MRGQSPVLIVGAGIGGLTLARALLLSGIPCQLFERSPTLGAAGAGIMIQTAAMLALKRLGLADAVLAAGSRLKVGWIKSERGTVLGRMPLGFLEHEFGVPSVALHRRRLQEVLLGATGEVPLHLGAELVSYEADDSGVTASFSNGERVRGSLLIGADGLRSAVRRQLLGDAPLRYSGYTSWRGVARGALAVAAHEVTEMWGRGVRFGYASLGHGETYWFAVQNAEPGQTDADSLERVRVLSAGFSGPVGAILSATSPEQVLRTDIHDRIPVPAWTSGRVALLGDAAHPTTPNLGQGGCMAIEDAVVLGHALAHSPDLGQAFMTYEAARVRTASAIVDASYQMGRIAQLAHPVTATLRNVALRLTPERLVRARLRQNAVFSLGSGGIWSRQERATD